MTVITFPMRNDVWLDNGLELFGHWVTCIARQYPHVVQIQWQPDGLKITLHDAERFVDLLDDEIHRHIETTLHYKSERTGNPVLKPFVGFNQQPPKQRPPLFQEDQRRSFLNTIFLSPSGKQRRQAHGCPLCGEVITTGDQKLTLSVYPFVTKIKSLSGIRTRWVGNGLRGFVTNSPVCPRCYFLGSLVWLDDALLYLCDIGGSDGTAVMLLPAPPTSDLLRLHTLKSYRPKLGERRTNVRFRRKHQTEDRDVQDGRFSLLLAFLERTLYEIAAESGGVTDLFAEAQKRVSDGWLFMNIPQGRLKNIVAHDLILDEPIMRLLVNLVERDILPYAYLIAELWITDDKGKRLHEEIPSLHETLAESILTDTFHLFANAFIPKPRRQLRFPFALETDLETLIQLWRWSQMDNQTLETVKKAGRALAAIAASRKQPILLYALERVRTPSDLLEVLKEGVHHIIGLEPEEMHDIPLHPLEQLTEFLHRVDSRRFNDLKNTLVIFAGIAYAKDIMAGSKTSAGGTS